MTIIRDPFDTGGYSLAEMTQAINILPNLYTRLAQIGLFRFEGVSQRSVIIEQYEGVLSLLPSVPLGGPATVGTREGRSMRSFALPWIPHDDVVLPADIQGQPALGGAFDAADPLVEVMNRKLLLMRRKHAQTREYMEMNALRGIVKDGAGTTLYNYFTEFGLAQISVDFVLGTAGTNVQGKVREVLRAIEDNLLGEAMTSVHALVSREFFDKLIAHPKTEEAYKFYASTGAQPLREDVRRNFPFGGILFGYLGDRFGRKQVLVVTFCMMGLCTTLIGLIPSYASIGIWAPIILVLVRIIQGPYTKDAALDYSDGWESILDHLEAYLQASHREDQA